RRRHTRFSRDWSSDVCSSDLATAMDRLELHYEQQDALAVERGKWHLAEHLCRCGVLQVVVGGRTVKGDLVAVGEDWAQLSTGIVRLASCEQLRPLGRGKDLQRS